MNTKMVAYHNDPAIKAKYIARIQEHTAADQLIQGTGWENGKGCAVGCTLEDYDHSRYPIELGIPEWLARLEDRIFEGLPKAEAMAWPEAFLEAIHPGAYLEPVRHQLAIRRMDRLIALQNTNLGKYGEKIDAVIAQTVASMMVVRSCHEAEIGGDVCDLPSAARSAAWSAAQSAAESAQSAAQSAAESARSAAWSAAESARSAAQSAAESARSAAWSAAESARSAARSVGSAQSAAYIQEASDLLELLRECTP